MTTVHLIYPHADRISCPDAIGCKVAEGLRARGYQVVHYDWNEARTIEPGSDDVLIGHPHPAAWTAFRRSVGRPGWRRRIMLAPYSNHPGALAFAEQSVRSADLFLAITGRYWFDRIDRSLFAPWRPKMVHVDLAVDRSDFPPLKEAFNSPGTRRFLYIGHASGTKNVSYLGAIARGMPEARFSWIGRSEPLKGVHRLGVHDFRSSEAKRLVACHDFLISPSRADASPATILEAMGWGVIPVCTPTSGYGDQQGIVNMPLDDVPGALGVLRRLQFESEAELRSLQRRNWEAIDRHFNWERFNNQVIEAIESDSSPEIASRSMLRAMRIAAISAVDARTAAFRARELVGHARGKIPGQRS